MYSKYTTPTASADSRLLTNDVYLAAYLLTQGCRLRDTVRNDRRRVSFVVEGDNVRGLRHAYRSGPVYLNVRFFREKLLTLRRQMDGKQRSAPCPQTESPTRSSRV